MTILPSSLERFAREFWAGTGLQETFPRDIEKAVALKLPLAVVKLPQLTVKAVGQWLERQGIVPPLPLDPRDLLGCLVAYRGYGIIFVCGVDTPEEQRLTLAHEVAHFLVDYLWPRREIIRALGTPISEVLDGVRAPTVVERAAAILSHVRLGTYVRLIPRPGKDEDTEPFVAQAENRADRLALELIAPSKHIRHLLQDFSTNETMIPEKICSALAGYFGLPVYAFDGVARQVNHQPRPISFLADVKTALRRRP